VKRPDLQNVDLQKYGRIESVLELIYCEHPAVHDIAVFVDQFGQPVVLAVANQRADQLRPSLEALGAVRIADLVVVAVDDPLVRSLFPRLGEPDRDLVWHFLIGTVETLTMAGYRFCPSCRHVMHTPAQIEAHQHRHDTPRHDGDCHVHHN
jgi:hypothetical protein